ncbi:MAG: hypothetical protein BMS9Abin32_095 [Gammaproteobacteria bacterium]|nr:MAG: hypothetical protein BMS9Abin32_095 [Gammaproteobacteria bacterium]
MRYFPGSSVFAIAIITVAAIFLFAFAFVFTNATLFLTTVLFIVAISLPVVAPLFASVVSYNQVFVVYRICAVTNVIACENGAIQKSEKAQYQ